MHKTRTTLEIRGDYLIIRATGKITWVRPNNQDTVAALVKAGIMPQDNYAKVACWMHHVRCAGYDIRTDGEDWIIKTPNGSGTPTEILNFLSENFDDVVYYLENEEACLFLSVKKKLENI